MLNLMKDEPLPPHPPPNQTSARKAMAANDQKTPHWPPPGRRGRPNPWPRDDDHPRLTFSPLAWLKLMLFLHGGDGEVGGFGVSAEDDLLYVADFVTVRQRCTAVTVEFEDEAVADHFDRCVDGGLAPNRFARIWCHTHPGDSAAPSLTDEGTFRRVFGGCDWALMFIAARGGATYARLQFFAGPGGSVLLAVAVDWAAWPTLAIEHAEQMTGQLCDWIAEYAQNVRQDTRQHHPLLRLASEDDEGRSPFQPVPGWEDDLDRLCDWQNGEREAVRQFEEGQDQGKGSPEVPA
jgi:hypothetical protein